MLNTCGDMKKFVGHVPLFLFQISKYYKANN